METLTKEIQTNITPDNAITRLKDGNNRFVNNNMLSRSYNKQVEITAEGQAPFAVILSCIDSRVPVETIFDQGIGDLFSTRVAGNIVNEDVLGSLEYSCKVAGSKLVLVLGHTKCGAVTAACNNVELGNITSLLNKIQPAVKSINISNTKMDENKIEEVSILNVKNSIENIRKNSSILAEMERNGEIEIVGATYSVGNGTVNFLT
ncbi:MAG: carbonic anhydrase [Flavobacteriales bacterium]|nr:carbonic anhydrase [Flavobacteriales bacterium]